MKSKAREIILVSALLAIGGFFYLNSIDLFKNCHYGMIEGLCNSGLFIIGSIFLIGFPIFVFSLVTYLLPLKVIISWQKFTYWYVAIFALIVLIFPESNGGGGWISGGGPTKATYGLLLSVLYFLLSVILIIRKSWQLRGK